jgi:branched-chain amino acid transport system substrate-binding protein
LINCVKQAREFGLDKRIRMATLLLYPNIVHAAGLDVMQGLLAADSFYWDLNERTRAFARRALEDISDAPPNASQAGCYAATLHYLKTVADMGPGAAKADGVATVNQMKAMKWTIREDGRVMVTAYLFQVKTPADSTGPWDLYTTVTAIPPERAFRPIAEGHCGFVKV